jgi:RNA recognition motif-containing protein
MSHIFVIHPHLLFSFVILLQRKREKSAQKEKEKPKNTSVYVTGLPPDTTLQELLDYFAKGGIIKKDPETCTFLVLISLSLSLSLSHFIHDLFYLC